MTNISTIRERRNKARGLSRAREKVRKFYGLYLKQGNKCAGCQDFTLFWKLTTDHIYPTSKGGSDDIANIQLLCALCNAIKRDETNARLQELLIRREELYSQAIAEYLENDWDLDQLHHELTA